MKNKDGIVILIFIQTKLHKKLYKMFGGLLQLADGTYKIVLYFGLSLYTVMVRDNHGNGIPAGHYFLLTESQETIQQGLKIFKEVNKKTNRPK